MDKYRTIALLAAMEAIAGQKILQNPKQPKKTNTIKIVRQGHRNKKCPGCGHKKKKCTCE